MLTYMARQITVNRKILDDDRYRYLFSVEVLNKLTLSGKPFRDAYKEVGIAINEGRFNPEKNIEHTHEGSIGNLCNDMVQVKMKRVIDGFAFEVVKRALEGLIGLNEI